MTLIGEKGERAVNESPNGEESQILADPEQADLVSYKTKLTYLARKGKGFRRSQARNQRVHQKKFP